MPSCSICFIDVNSFKDLIRHIKLFHCFEKITEYKCIEPLCFRNYNSFDSFSRHLLTHNVHTVVKQKLPSSLHTDPFIVIEI